MNLTFLISLRAENIHLSKVLVIFLSASISGKKIISSYSISECKRSDSFKYAQALLVSWNLRGPVIISFALIALIWVCRDRGKEPRLHLHFLHCLEPNLD